MRDINLDKFHQRQNELLSWTLNENFSYRIPVHQQMTHKNIILCNEPQYQRMRDITTKYDEQQLDQIEIAIQHPMTLEQVLGYMHYFNQIINTEERDSNTFIRATEIEDKLLWRHINMHELPFFKQQLGHILTTLELAKLVVAASQHQAANTVIPYDVKDKENFMKKQREHAEQAKLKSNQQLKNENIEESNH